MILRKNQLTLRKIETDLNSVRLRSPLIQIEEKKNKFFINGKVINDQQNFDIDKLKPILGDLLSTIETEKVDFNSTNTFSFNINKNLKIE